MHDAVPRVPGCENDIRNLGHATHERMPVGRHLVESGDRALAVDPYAGELWNSPASRRFHTLQPSRFERRVVRIIARRHPGSKEEYAPIADAQMEAVATV